MPVRVLVAAVVVLLLGLGVAAWTSPALSVRGVEVQGAAVLTREQLVTTLDVAPGTPLLQVDLDEAASRVAAVPRVATARVERVLPSTVRLVVTERVPAAWVEAADGPHLLDASGVDFAVEAPAPGLVRLQVAAPGPADPATRAALDVLVGLPEGLRAQVAQVGAQTPDAVELALGDGRTVRWGGSADGARKAAVASALLTQPGTVLDVSSPDLPTAS